MGKTFKKNQSHWPKSKGKVFVKDYQPWKKNKNKNKNIIPSVDSSPPDNIPYPP